MDKPSLYGKYRDYMEERAVFNDWNYDEAVDDAWEFLDQALTQEREKMRKEIIEEIYWNEELWRLCGGRAMHTIAALPDESPEYVAAKVVKGIMGVIKSEYSTTEDKEQDEHTS